MPAAPGPWPFTVPPMSDTPSITEILARAQPGSEVSAAALLPVVYNELRSLAASFLRGDRAHTLQPTALVHEAYVKLIGSDRLWSGRDHFMAVAARAMRQVLVDHARARKTLKRGGDHKSEVSISVIGEEPGSPSCDLDVAEVHDLLETLAVLSPRPARVAEMRLFGGMTSAQMATVLGVSDFTVKQDWQFARAWLAGKMQQKGRHGA
ncbi:MAG: ECF-type sigma factor [Phycisphaerales bacterium]